MRNNAVGTIFCQGKNGAILVIILIALFFLGGCQGTSALYQGKYVDPEFAIPLPGNVAEEQWETYELAIKYGYSEDNLYFQIIGQVNLADQYAEIYHYLDRLDVYLLFLDNSLTVIKAEKLASSFSTSPKDSIPFDRSFKIPQNTTAFSFAYYGTVRELDRKDGNIATLWHVPK